MEQEAAFWCTLFLFIRFCPCSLACNKKKALYLPNRTLRTQTWSKNTLTLTAISATG